MNYNYTRSVIAAILLVLLRLPNSNAQDDSVYEAKDVYSGSQLSDFCKIAFDSQGNTVYLAGHLRQLKSGWHHAYQFCSAINKRDITLQRATGS